MIGYKEFLDSLQQIPDEPLRNNRIYDPDRDEPRNRVKNPLYNKKAEKIWGGRDMDYLPPHPSDWDTAPLRLLRTDTLMSPQRYVEKDLLAADVLDRSHPIMVTRTLKGEHIIQDGNHRAIHAHGHGGEILARVFDMVKK